MFSQKVIFQHLKYINNKLCSAITYSKIRYKNEVFPKILTIFNILIEYDVFLEFILENEVNHYE